jgi:lysophospholipase L1-like esterase
MKRWSFSSCTPNGHELSDCSRVYSVSSSGFWLEVARAATDPNIHYMDGLQLFNETEALTMPDGIHPNAAGYRTIAANFVERVPKAWLANASVN